MQDPNPGEIREALGRILDSATFAHAPQLVAFLRFVVESVLAGHGGNIKSYTIAVDALGRSENFDPRTDAIVRVEAGRLRRALARYYQTEGSESAVVIELPLGTYVPSIHRRPAREDLLALPARLWQRLRSSSAGLQAALAIAIIVAAGAGAVMMQLRGARDSAADPLPAEAVLPSLFIAPFEVRGASAGQAAELQALRDRLRYALARFDEIEVAAEGASIPTSSSKRNIYRLSGVADFHGDGVTLALVLDDADDGTVAWAQTFDLKSGSLREAGRDVTQQVATRLAQPYGVIYAHELADSAGNPYFRCILSAFEFRRTFDRASRPLVEDCLTQLTTLYPGLADGFALRSLNILNRYYEGDGDASAALEQSLMLAQRAVDLKPQSARARHALMSALFARGDTAAALAEGEVSLSLNPHDMIILHAYGLHLLLAGQVEKGAALMRRAAALSPVRPALFEFGLFLASYVLGDEPGSALQARLFTTSDYPLIFLARAVIAARSGDRARARDAIERLVAVNPGWRLETRQRLQRYFRSPEVVDRLMVDLRLAGIAAAD